MRVQRQAVPGRAPADGRAAARPATLAVLILWISLAAVSGASAQAPRPPQPLSLEQAREIARANNPGYRQALNQITSARANELSVRSQFLPELSASFGSGASLSRRRTGEDNFGRPIEGERVTEYTGSNSSQNLSLSWLVFDGGARFRNVRAAGAGREAAVAGAAATESTMEAVLTRRYYEAQRTAARIALEERLLEAAEANHAAAERLVRVAAISPVELLTAELEVTRQRVAVETARGAARVAMVELAEQMGTGEPEGWELVSPLPEVFDPTTLDADALVERAYRVSPRLQQLSLQAGQAEHQARAAGAERWPRISANAGFGRSVGLEGYGALFEPNPFNQNFNFGINVSIPLFSQYQTSQQITQLRVAATNADEAARATRLEIGRLVRSALITLESAYRTLQLTDASADVARRQVELANQQFRLGGISVTDVQDIVSAAAAAEREALDARYTFASDLATLEEVIGGSVHGEE